MFTDIVDPHDYGWRGCCIQDLSLFRLWMRLFISLMVLLPVGSLVNHGSCLLNWTVVQSSRNRHISPVFLWCQFSACLPDLSLCQDLHSIPYLRLGKGWLRVFSETAGHFTGWVSTLHRDISFTSPRQMENVEMNNWLDECSCWSYTNGTSILFKTMLMSPLAEELLAGSVAGGGVILLQWCSYW